VLDQLFHKVWYGKKGFVWCLLWPFSLIYGLVVFIRKLFYKIGVFKGFRAPCKIVIVGNQTVGGGGKTPMVIALVDFFQKQGKQVGVICKGYKGSLTKQPQNVDLDKHTAQQVGDEAILLKQKVSCPVVAAQNRVEGAKYLLTQLDCDIIISDDGLTHYALERDLEIILENKALGLGNGSLLPAGPLRERSQSKSCQRIFVESVTLNKYPPLQNALHFDSSSRGEYFHSENQLEIAQPEGGSKSAISGRGEDSKAAIYRYPGKIYNLKSGKEVNIKALKAKLLVAIAAIAHPSSFFYMLGQLGLVCTEKAYPDHYYFKQSDFDSAVVYIMTEKDAVKCADIKNAQIVVLPLMASLSEELIMVLSSFD
jgi:tetraacyldisaccharide 4'-kinase